MRLEKCFHSHVSPFSLTSTEQDDGIVVNLSVELINVPLMTLCKTNSYRADVAAFAIRPLRPLPLEAKLS